MTRIRQLRYPTMIKKINRGSAVLLLLLCQALFTHEVVAANIQATVDRNPVNLDESFQIIFSADETPDGEPDFGPLDEDFDILSQSSSNNVSLINGKMKRSIRWTLNVMAKHTGNLEVPPISFGNDTSEPLPLLVNENSASKELNKEDDIFIEVEATPENPYLQAQILYTVRIYTRVEIARASINEPEQADAVIEKLGDDKNFQTQVKGGNYMVTERRYAIFPQKSGMITIAPLVLTAEVVTNSRSGFNGFFSSNVTRTKRASSKAISLMVKPAPASFTGKHWLAAEQLELKEEWSGDLQKIKVGEPVTRTLTVQAKGSTVGQLPELHSAASDESVKFYPDQPVLQEQKNVDGLLAKRQEKIALIPSKAGSFKLPAIEIPWFNTRTQQMEVAKIPEKMIEVASSGPAAAETVKPLAVNPEAKRQPLVIESQATEQKNVWIWVSVALAIGWLSTLVFFLTRRPRRKADKHGLHDLQDERAPVEYLQHLKKACADHDPLAAKNALLDWGRQKFNTNSLGAIAARCDARLRDEILALNKALYGKEAEQWQGKKLYQAFTENRARQQWTAAKDDALEPLFYL
ncbi:BatD family protein [Methylomicrobium sp. Wu6]|uniref:BatD family protein n=1 Tax=Methylomicrobium sp. Wu6 TaxID=3107928 RepID=UPI002DD64A2E|nr:BatD family protein [Methylomicrobium sp. Wu6]MEC4747600.1 BatD family protein [Methylomicrobium sp. Wu6]